jgi:DNA-binding transcriptional MerR regulator
MKDGNRSCGLKIGDVAERDGVNLQTIRYYEREGLYHVEF